MWKWQQPGGERSTMAIPQVPLCRFTASTTTMGWHQKLCYRDLCACAYLSMWHCTMCVWVALNHCTLSTWVDKSAGTAWSFAAPSFECIVRSNLHSDNKEPRTVWGLLLNWIGRQTNHKLWEEKEKMIWTPFPSGQLLLLWWEQRKEGSNLQSKNKEQRNIWGNF